MYATTKEFLIRFGLNELTDLPKVEDMAEALGIEGALLVERTPGEDELPLDEPDGGSDQSAHEDTATEPTTDAEKAHAGSDQRENVAPAADGAADVESVH